MLPSLLKFEWRYHTHKLLFLFASLAFAFFAFVFSVAGFRLPQVYMNSPYMIAYIMGILSMGAIFPAVVFTSNAILRDRDHRMEEMVYSSPISKWHFLFSRFMGVFLACFASFACMLIGLLLSTYMPWIDAEKVGAFHLSYYLWPLLVYVLPNVLLAVSLVFLIASLSKNRIMLYLSGLFLYVLYVLASMYSNAPWLATASPATVEAISLSAKLDPFGISAFFEQSRYWSHIERNTELTALKGNFLTNRLLWISISLLSFGLAYWRFSFRKAREKKRRKVKQHSAPMRSIPLLRVETFSASAGAQRLALWSSFQLEVKAIFKSLSFLILILLWALIYTSEALDTLSGGSRMPDDYPLSGLLFGNLIEVIPFFGIVSLIFYSNEQIWRSRILNVDLLTYSYPVRNYVFFLSKFLSLALIPLLMISLAILINIGIQLTKGFLDIDLGLYLSAYYYAGLPLLCVAILALFIQSLFSRRYLGMLITALFLLITSSRLSSLFGIRHPLLKYAQPLLEISYSEMNGFGIYAEAFHWRMSYWFAVAFLLAILCFGLWGRKLEQALSDRIQVFHSQINRKTIFLSVLSILIALSSASFIFYKSNIEENSMSREEARDWSQAYEEKYKSYENNVQPIPVDLYTEIELYPETHSYKVYVRYLLKNKSEKALGRALMGLSFEAEMDSLHFSKGEVESYDADFAQYQLVFPDSLQPGESFEMQAYFHSSWNGFQSHTAFNSIVENGSFIRMSRYFPFFGYHRDYELSNEEVRRARNMPPQESALIPFTESPGDSLPYDYDFIELEYKISTSADQLALGAGSLLKQWTENGRNFFHYKLERAIPFRFAFSSAKYALTKTEHKGISIELYYHPKHAYNTDRLLQSARQSLDYCIEAFGPYQYEHIRFVEVSDFTSGFAATAYPNTLFIRESMGFFSDMREKGSHDIVNQLVAHELAHQWWGGQLNTPSQEGAILLSEMLAQYTEFMIYEQTYGKTATIDALNVEMDLYLRDRAFSEEVPLISAAYDHPHIPYSKGAKVMYQLREMMGEDSLNLALKKVLQTFAWPDPPPSSLDLLDEIVKQAPDSLEVFIRQMFTQIRVYELKLEQARIHELAEGIYEVEMEVMAKMYEGDSLGNKKEINFQIPVQIAALGEGGIQELIRIEWVELTEGKQSFRMQLKEKPYQLAVDPYILNIDVDRMNNFKQIKQED
ncbi:MAG: M1 family aminopeptidase [Bacteroidia bacterium]|nr:M1 family aminopeptidase [Bacteroidia bacterium]